MALNDKMQALRDKWERLSQRERTMVAAMGVTFVLMVTLIVGFLISDGLSSMEERNTAMRQALRDLETQRDAYMRNKQKAVQLETRLGTQPIQLQGYLESAAKEAGVEIPDQSERPPAAAGKKWIERTVDLRLRAVTLDQLTKFMKAVEMGKSLVVVTQLNVRTRDDKHQQLDVEMSVSTYERDTGKGAAKKGDKGS
jgi:type II secretory pathway component PulM